MTTTAPNRNKLDAFFQGFSDAEEQLDFAMADEQSTEVLEIISTGSIALDDALSSGGLPRGRLIQYYGAAGSGKSLLAMLAIKEAQAADPTSQQVWIDAEQTFDPKWAKTLGCDISRIIIIRGDMAANGRLLFEMLLGTPKEDAKTHALKGKSKEGLFDKIINDEFNINLVILDSLGAVVPPGEDTAAVGKMGMSLMARFLSTTLRKLSLEVKKANVPFIIINHKKDNMSAYGADHTYSGGNVYSHFLSANVYFESVNRKDAQILDEKENKVGHPLRATIEKSKFGPWPRKCEFKVHFGKGIIDRHEEIAQLVLDYNIVTKPTAVSYEYNGTKWVGMPKFCAAIEGDQKLASEFVAKIAVARENKWIKTECAQVEVEAVEVVKVVEKGKKNDKNKNEVV